MTARPLSLKRSREILGNLENLSTWFRSLFMNDVDSLFLEPTLNSDKNFHLKYKA